MNGAGTANTGNLSHPREPAPNAPAGNPISHSSSTPAPNAATTVQRMGPAAADLQNQPASSKRSAKKGTAKPSLSAHINESNRVTKQTAAIQRVPCALPRLSAGLQLPAILPILSSAETASSAHVAGPRAPITSTTAGREPSPFLPRHPPPGLAAATCSSGSGAQSAPVTEQKRQKEPGAKPPRPRARADESGKVTTKPTRAPPRRPITPPTNTPSLTSSIISTPHSVGEIVPPRPPTPKKKSFKGRGPCKGRDWSIRPEQQSANGQASGSQAPAPPQQQFLQPAPQAYPSLPAGMQMGATAHAQELSMNWAPLPEQALQQQLLAAPHHGYDWAGIGHDVSSPLQEPLSDYDATIARQLASQLAWFPQDASQEFDASSQLAPEESRLFLKPKL
ncbi:hypothetical protein BDZ91DRAFT_750442 [Kalaharituber pfeilii]|nr:hypothetical protein BDZ91DRAFT_750442 [Kalaharituber pfeilii]